MTLQDARPSLARRSHLMIRGLFLSSSLPEPSSKEEKACTGSGGQSTRSTAGKHLRTVRPPIPKSPGHNVRNSFGK